MCGVLHLNEREEKRVVGEKMSEFREEENKQSSRRGKEWESRGVWRAQGKYSNKPYTKLQMQEEKEKSEEERREVL